MTKISIKKYQNHTKNTYKKTKPTKHPYKKKKKKKKNLRDKKKEKYTFGGHPSKNK
ncbi:MAG: hypothetical protein LBD05_01450 [Mycoplasmataceae bacterium]|jgi:hypothetical protein|nr:hypothetical protein [Mycoplasmataceae bacterium]